MQTEQSDLPAFDYFFTKACDWQWHLFSILWRKHWLSANRPALCTVYKELYVACMQGDRQHALTPFFS
jgi:hypothetical protein